MANRKRTADKSILDGIHVLLLDIEGTTTPVAFVKEKLFPYVKENVKVYLEKNFSSDELQEDIQALREQVETKAETDLEGGNEKVATIPEKDNEENVIIDAVVAYVLGQMEMDRKTTSLKRLQGHMWREAYNCGSIKGEIYDDVVPAINKLIAQGIKVYIYSSGSVEAQKLLFGHSDKGDLQELLSGYYDTSIGAKVDAESYKTIAKQLDESPHSFLFLTDLPTEAAAATAAGFRTCIVVRDGNAPLSTADQQSYPIVHSFDELFDGDMEPKQKLKPNNDETEEFVLSSNSEDSDDDAVVISEDDVDDDDDDD